LTGASAARGTRAQHPAPEHIAKLMVELASPRPADVICDPSAGNCELLAAAAEYVRVNFPASLRDAHEREHFERRMFQGFVASKSMLRGGAKRMRGQGVKHPNVELFDVIEGDLAERAAAFTLVLGSAPCGGGDRAGAPAKETLRTVRTQRPELSFLARVLQLLALNGRAVVIVPESALSGATAAHRRIRSRLLEEQTLEAVIALPGGMFAPYAGTPAAILVCARSESVDTHHVWFYDLVADGYSSDQERTPLLPEEKLGATPRSQLSAEEHARNNLPDVMARWRALHSAKAATAEFERPRSAQSFCVPKSEIAAQGYDLSIKRYKLMAPTHVEGRRPHEILAELAGLEAEIFQGMKDLVGLLK
jgi:type I restriction enzyme M protein